jgi:hypothetical protein
MNTKTLNYLGQLRLYSLVDLILMLYSGGYRSFDMLGPVLIWVGFLSYLEARHKDTGRAVVPNWVAAIFGVTSLFLFGFWKGLLFSLFSFVYTKKKLRYWGLVSPLCRGLQVLTIMGPSQLGWIAAGATALRNLAGDWRDVIQDRTEGRRRVPEGLKTWAVVLGVKTDWVFLHLFATMSTTFIWWHYARIGISWLLAIYLVQIASYWATPRSSNPKAMARIRQILGLKT